MKVSVIIPTLNEEKYLGRALESLMKQKTNLVYGKDWEIIIADAESADKTREIASKYTNKIAMDKKKTIAAGRHLGVQKAEGEYLLFTDADVIVDPNWLAENIKGFETGAVAVMGKVHPHNGSFFENLSSEILNVIATVLNIINVNFVAGSNMGVRKDVYDRVGGFNVNLVTSEDCELVRRLAKEGKVKYLPNAFVLVSMRRVRAWGLFYYFIFHFTNFFREHIFHSCHKKYEPVR